MLPASLLIFAGTAAHAGGALDGASCRDRCFEPCVAPERRARRGDCAASTATCLSRCSATTPFDLTLKSLPALRKVHHSTAFNFIQVPTTSSNQLLVEYARITHAYPLDLNPDATPVFNSTTVFEAVKICKLATNCSLTLNFSPWSDGTWKSPMITGAAEKHHVEYYLGKLEHVATWVAEANRRLNCSVNVSAMLIDQEAGWVVTAATNATYKAAMIRKSDLIFNATLTVFPHLEIDLNGWGCVERALGLSKLPGPPMTSSVDGSWCGLVDAEVARGWGNEDVRNCGCNGYTLRERAMSSAADLYMVGNFEVTRESLNRTANHGLANGVPSTNPWIWLGGGYRQFISMQGGFNTDFHWDYELVNSWMLGKLVNDPYYGEHPSRFGRFDMVAHGIFWPPPVGSSPAVTTAMGPDGKPCNIMLRHFIAYVWGANGVVTDLGQYACTLSPRKLPPASAGAAA